MSQQMTNKYSSVTSPQQPTHFRITPTPQTAWKQLTGSPHHSTAGCNQTMLVSTAEAQTSPGC